MKIMNVLIAAWQSGLRQRRGAGDARHRRCLSCTRARTRWPSSTRRTARWWAACRPGKTPTSWPSPTTGSSRSRAITPARAARGQHPLRHRHRGAEGAAPGRSGPAEPPSRPVVRRREAVLHRRGEHGHRPLRPASNKVDWLLGLGQDRTHMIVVSKDQKTIFTSNVSSNTISIIEHSGGPRRRASRRARRAAPGGSGGPPPGGPGGPPPTVRAGLRVIGPPGAGLRGRAGRAASGWAGRRAGLEADGHPGRPGTGGLRRLAGR